METVPLFILKVFKFIELFNHVIVYNQFIVFVNVGGKLVFQSCSLKHSY